MACLWSPTNESKHASSTLAMSLVRLDIGSDVFRRERMASWYFSKAILKCVMARSVGSRSLAGEPGGDSHVFSKVLYKAPNATTA